ncbi:hypothetical protein J2S89_003298 [Arthrobacter bambusae]|nr:hypothetical protein [Arthrobacter bambusae]MDQ0099669.1 hypothetical protein [Arthrobacter bambusae]
MIRSRFPEGVRRAAVIAICTYKREGLLPRLLDEIYRQVKELSPGFVVRILVIDNDPEGSASSCLDLRRSAVDKDLFTYCHEPNPGVGHARNLAFSSVTEGEWLIFFDDDQMPGPAWLQEFLAAPDLWQGDVFVGPVRPRLPDEYPNWAEGAWAWSRPEYADGAVRRHAGFGNILISPSALQNSVCKVPRPFLNGPGEDTAVTSALTAEGYKIVHVLGAWAWEAVTADRLEIRWVMDRRKAAGRVWARLVLDGHSGSASLAVSFVGLVARALLLRVRAAIHRSPSDAVRANAHLATAAGYVLEIRGYLSRKIGAAG